MMDEEEYFAAITEAEETANRIFNERFIINVNYESEVNDNPINRKYFIMGYLEGCYLNHKYAKISETFKKIQNEIKNIMKTTILIIAIALTSCASVKRYSYEATYLNEGEIQKNHVKCSVAKIQRNAQGFKHTLVTAKNDTIYRTYQRPLEKGKCYWIWQTRGEKNL